MVVEVISVIFSNRDGRLGDARHDGFRRGGRGHVSSRCAHQMLGHSVCIRERLVDSDTIFVVVAFMVATCVHHYRRSDLNSDAYLGLRFRRRRQADGNDQAENCNSTFFSIP